MSWRPFFDVEQLEVLKAEVADHPQGAGRGGLSCPNFVTKKALEEYSYAVIDSKTTGNCCPLAFTQAAMAQGLRSQWKKMSDTKRCADARRLTCEWATKHRLDKLWGGWSFQEVAEIVSHCPYDKWLSRLRLADSWADIAFLHALACACCVDALVVQGGAGPARLLGQSLMVGDHDCKALVPVALLQHYHFWALVPPSSRPLEQVAITISPEHVVSHRGCQVQDHDEDFDALDAIETAVAGREREVQLCEALAVWSPFELPSEQIVQAVQKLGLN